MMVKVWCLGSAGMLWLRYCDVAVMWCCAVTMVLEAVVDGDLSVVQ